MAERWRNYFSMLANVENTEKLEEPTPVEGPFKIYIKLEVRNEVKSMKNGKAPGPSGISSVTMSYNEMEHTKSAESAIPRCSVAQQVHLLSQLRDLELMGTSSLPTPGLCQPQSSPEP